MDDAGNETLAPARFLDWPSSGNKAGVEAGYRALIVWAMQDAHQLSLNLVTLLMLNYVWTLSTG